VRGAQWGATREGLRSPIIALQRSIRVLEQEIKDLESAAVAEAAIARKKNPTASDLLSALSIEDDADEHAGMSEMPARLATKTSSYHGKDGSKFRLRSSNPW
jgi:hypothetical protein